MCFNTLLGRMVKYFIATFWNIWNFCNVECEIQNRVLKYKLNLLFRTQLDVISFGIVWLI